MLVIVVVQITDNASSLQNIYNTAMVHGKTWDCAKLCKLCASYGRIYYYRNFCTWYTPGTLPVPGTSCSLGSIEYSQCTHSTFHMKIFQCKRTFLHLGCLWNLSLPSVLNLGTFQKCLLPSKKVT